MIMPHAYRAQHRSGRLNWPCNGNDSRLGINVNPNIWQLGQSHSERELEKALIANVEASLRAMGGVFAFMGSQFRLETDGRASHRKAGNRTAKPKLQLQTVLPFLQVPYVSAP